MTPLPSPAEIMQWLDQAATELDDLGKRLEDSHIALGDAEAEYIEKLDEALLLVVEEYEDKEQRLPGEDIRLAKARKRIDFEVFTRYRKAKRLVEALSLHARKLESAVGARQSTLKGLREGMSLEGYGEPPEKEKFPHPQSPGSGEWRNA